MWDRHTFRSGRWHTEGAVPPDEDGPTFLVVNEETATSSSIYINWTLDEPGDGYIEYGLSTDYGSQTTPELGLLTYHRQQITGLAAGTTYYYNIVSRDADGNATEYTGDFTTAGAVSATSATYGPAFGGYGGKGNLEMHGPGDPNGWVGFRFKAVHGGTVANIRTCLTNRSVPYGEGDGGRYRVGVQSVTSALMPSGTWLGETVDINTPIVPGAFNINVTYSSGPTLVAGTTYAIVMQNVHPVPTTNYSSSNHAWSPGLGPTPWPFYPNNENITVREGPSWVVDTSHVPSFDLRYSSGNHEGMSGIQYQDFSFNTNVGIVNSGSMGCWRFTYPAGFSSITVDAVNWFVQKVSGTTNATVTVRKGGVSQATGTFTSSGAIGTGSRAWTRAALSGNVTINAGDVIRVEIETTAGEYRLPLMLWRDSSTTAANHMESYPYSEGGGSNIHRADDGVSGTTPAWSAWYAHTTYGAYFEIA